MYALNNKYNQVGVVGAVSNVLLRRSRRLLRSVVFFLSRDMKLPRSVDVAALVVFFSAVATYGVVAGGHTLQVSHALTSTLGFSIERIEISGNKYMSDNDVVAALNLTSDNISTLAFNVSSAREKIAALPWVQSVDVQKIYPGRVVVSLVERQPFAVWQHDECFDIIDRDGRIIVPYGGNNFAHLPQLVGAGAQEAGLAFVATLAKYPELAGQIRAYVRVGGRRWDLVLNNGVRIKLPEFGTDQRIAELVDINRSNGLFERDVEEIDARLDGRVTVSLNQVALEKYKKKISEEDRLLRLTKGGRV